mgnify:CR=1 FL=1
MDELKRRHCELINDISNEMIPDSNETKNFTDSISSLKGLGRGSVARQPTLQDKMNLMVSAGHMSPGNYGHLKRLMRQSGNGLIVTMIEEAEEEMQTIKNGE